MNSEKPTRIEEQGLLRWRYAGTNWSFDHLGRWIDAATGIIATDAEAQVLDAAEKKYGDEKWD